MAIHRKKHLNMLCPRINRFLTLHEVIYRVTDVFQEDKIDLQI